MKKQKGFIDKVLILIIVGFVGFFLYTKNVSISLEQRKELDRIINEVKGSEYESKIQLQLNKFLEDKKITPYEMTDIVSLYNQYKNEKITTEPKSNKTIENEKSKSKSLEVDQNSKDEQGITINLIVWVIGFIVILSIIIGNFNKIKKED